MPFSFPSSPALNDTSTQNGRVFRYVGGNVWELADDPRWEYFKPLAPTSVTATATNAQAVVSWTAPAVVVPPVTDYVVQYSTNSGSTWTTFTDAVSTATSATVTGLTNGTAHVFRVAAVNGIGTGAYSTQSSAVTPTAGDPLFSSVALLLRMDGTGSTFVDSSSSPKTITAVGAATQSSAQSKFGGKSLALNGSDANLSLPSAGFTLAGDFVIEGWLYFNSVSTYATIAETRSSPSYSDFICGVYNVGGALRPDFVTAGGGGARLTGSSTAVPLNSWAYIAFVRSAGVLSVYVNGTRDATQINYSSTITPQSSTMLIGRNVDGDFVNGFIDEFRITVGNNRSYTGASITVPTAAFADGAMFAPTSLAATGGNAQVSLTWTAPSYNGGSAITDYSVQYSSDSGSTWTTFSRTASTTASQVVTGLTNGTAYVFRVAGINTDGTGTYTAASSSVTPIAALFSATAAGWSGAGTAASKLAAPSSPTDFLGATVADASFTAGVAGTVRVTGNHHDANDGYENRISKNGTVLYSVGNGTADFSVAVAAGDVIRVFTDGFARWQPNTRVWLVPS
jgi:titin